MRFATATVALVASASSALAIGNAVIINHCSHDVIVTSVSNTAGNPQTIKANGGQYSEQYRENPNGGGISLKVSQDGDSGPVCQFEYTYNPPTNPYPGVFWDLSLINGNIFADTAVALIPTIHSGNPGGSCYDVNCPGGQQCKDAYNSPFENAATHSCPADTDLTYYLCSDGKSQPAASPSPSPKPSPSPQPSPSPKPSPAAPPPAPVELKVETSPTPTPAPVAKSPTAFVLGYKEAGGPVVEMAAQKREVGHANHLERHRRIRRMHHARTVE